MRTKFCGVLIVSTVLGCNSTATEVASREQEQARQTNDRLSLELKSAKQSSELLAKDVASKDSQIIELKRQINEQKRQNGAIETAAREEREREERMRNEEAAQRAGSVARVAEEARQRQLALLTDEEKARLKEFKRALEKDEGVSQKDDDFIRERAWLLLGDEYLAYRKRLFAKRFVGVEETLNYLGLDDDARAQFYLESSVQIVNGTIQFAKRIRDAERTGKQFDRTTILYARDNRYLRDKLASIQKGK